MLVVILAGVMGITLLLFLLYHLYLIKCGVTTNENFRKNDYARGYEVEIN